MGISLCPKCDQSRVVYASDFLKSGLSVYFKVAPVRDDAEAEGAEERNSEVFNRNRLQVADNASGRQPHNKPDGNVNTPDGRAFGHPDHSRRGIQIYCFTSRACCHIAWRLCIVQRVD